MNPREEFLRHAADCERMAKSASDGASQLAWKQMAERWRHCASKTESLVNMCRREGTAGVWPQVGRLGEL